MQVNLKFDNSFSAKSLAGTAIPLGSASSGLGSPPIERFKGRANCQDPKCQHPEVILSTYNTTTVFEGKNEIRVCFACQKRRHAELLATAALLSAPVSQVELMAAARKVAQMVGHHSITGRKTKSLS
ncbi:MAG: hypothetical protein WCT25_00585 [Candidatus Paceibacterota bacterium]